MHTPYKKQSQFELFPAGPGSCPEGVKPRPVWKDLTLSSENIIVVCIIFMLGIVFSYAYGVENGRRTAARPAPVPDGSKAAAKSSAARKAESERDQARERNGSGFPREESVPVKAPELRLKSQPQAPVVDRLPQPPETAKNHYTIQVASFKSQTSAYKEAKNLEQKGFDIFLVPKGGHTIVCVGKFPQEKQAKAFSSKLKNRYKDCLVRRL